MEKEILILIEDGFRDEEVIYPYYRFREAGYKVTVVGPEADKEYRGKFGVSLKSDTAPAGVSIENAAALIIPGGNAPAGMREIPEMVDLVKKASLGSKIIAAICRGGLMLAKADIIKNRKVTGFKEIAAELEAAGGIYQDKEAVVDGNFVTSRIPDDLPAFCSSILELLAGKQE